MKPRLLLVVLVVGFAVIVAMCMFRVDADVAEVGVHLPARSNDDGTLWTVVGDPASSVLDERDTALIAPPDTLPDDPLPLGAFSQNRAILESLARAGRADAASRLGRILCGCRHHTPKTREQVEQDIAKLMASLPISAVDTQIGFGARVSQEMERQAFCAGATGLTDSDAARGLEWLVLAASLGDPYAMAVRFDVELERVGSGSAVLIDSANRLLALYPMAQRMLERAVAAGEPVALQNMARAHGTGVLAERDQVSARAYELAWLTASAQRGIVREDRRLYASGLDALRSRDAEERARGILAQCCVPP